MAIDYFVFTAERLQQASPCAVRGWCNQPCWMPDISSFISWIR